MSIIRYKMKEYLEEINMISLYLHKYVINEDLDSTCSVNSEFESQTSSKHGIIF